MAIIIMVFQILFARIFIPQWTFAADHPEGSHSKSVRSSEEKPSFTKVNLVDVNLQDQEGKTINFKSDVVGDRIVVINFIYTSCTTQCPLSSQVLASLQNEMRIKNSENVHLVSISLDPVTDTPQRLKEYSEKLDSGPGWTWLTGKKSDVIRLLDGLGVYSPDLISHPPVFLVGDGKNKIWKRINGLPSVDLLLSHIKILKNVSYRQIENFQLLRVSNPVDKHEKARGYFTDLPVITHDGQELKFFTDLLKDKIVLINLFFSGCEKSCPMVHNKLAKLQNELDGYLGRNVFFISVTIDPQPDTQEILARYAESFKPKAGWSFITGNPDDIKTITYRLGQISDNKEAHAPFLMVGDVNKVRWRKFLPNISNEMLARFIKTLAADHPASYDK